MIQPFVFIFGGTFTVKQIEKIKKSCTPTFKRANQIRDLDEIIRVHRPQCWVTIGANQTEFPTLFHASEQERTRWMHYESAEAFVQRLPLLVNVFVNAVFAIRDNIKGEKVSAFTSSYNSKKYIQRPLETLLKQTHTNWEWVIYDDSDGEENWNLLKKIRQRDPTRIRIFRSEGNSGVIGNVKQIASSLCRGDFILELDHDDELDPKAFEYLVQAARRFPEAGFFYSNYCFIHEDGRNSEHPDGFALGFGGYRRLWNEQFNKWTNISRSVPVTDITIRYLVGCPNHYRAWRTKTFQEIGGWCPDFHVADDYEILVRTFLHTTMCHVAYKSYTQYVNTPTKTSKNTFNNFTWLRNEQIQVLWRSMARSYNDKIHERVLTLQGNDPYYENWEDGAEPISIAYHQTPDYLQPLNKVFEPRDQNENEPLVFAVFCYDPTSSLDGGSGTSVYKAVAAMKEQTYKNVELMIVSAGAEEMLEPLMNSLIKENDDEDMVKFVQQHVSYWNFRKGEQGHVHPYFMCVNHALKRINTARFTMFLQDDNDFSSLPPRFVEKSMKYMRLRDDTHGLLLDPIPHIIYRTSLHEECGFLDDDKTDLIAILQEFENGNIVEFAKVSNEIDAMEEKDDDEEEDGEEEGGYMPNEFDEEIADDGEEEEEGGEEEEEEEGEEGEDIGEEGGEEKE